MDKTFFENNLTRVHDWIKAADEKVNIWIAFQGILLALIAPYISEKVLPFISKSSWFLVLLFVLAVVLFCYSLYISISAITPVLKSKGGKKSMIYFGHIANMEYDEFNNMLKNYKDNDYIEDLKSQIHISSKIALRKHKEFRQSILSLFVSVILFIPILLSIKL